MGWRITMGGAQVIPRQLGGWMVHDGQSGRWALDALPDSGAWQVTAYNTGLQPHTVYVTYLTRVIPRPAPARSVLTAEDLAEVPDLSMAGPPVAGRLWRRCRCSRWRTCGSAPADRPTPGAKR